jgi:hypothetical protein
VHVPKVARIAFFNCASGSGQPHWNGAYIAINQKLVTNGGCPDVKDNLPRLPAAAPENIALLVREETELAATNTRAARPPAVIGAAGVTFHSAVESVRVVVASRICAAASRGATHVGRIAAVISAHVHTRRRDSGILIGCSPLALSACRVWPSDTVSGKVDQMWTFATRRAQAFFRALS